MYSAKYQGNTYKTDTVYESYSSKNGKAISPIGTPLDDNNFNGIVASQVTEWEFGKNAITNVFYLSADKYKSPYKTVLLGDFTYNTSGLLEKAKFTHYAVEFIAKSSNGSTTKLYLKLNQSFSGSLDMLDSVLKNLEQSQVTNIDSSKFSKYFPEGWELSPFSNNLITSSPTKSTDANVSPSLYDVYYSDLTSGNAALTSKKINWKFFSDFSSADSSFYSALEWGSVNIKKMQKFQASAIDWTLVGFSSFETKQYKQINWSQVTVSSFTSSEYTEIDWGKVSYSGKKSITKASGLDWTQVNFDQVFASKKAYKKISWSEVSFSSFSSADYSEIQWDKVAYSGKKSITKADGLDWAQVNFTQVFSSKKAYKKISWSEVSFSSVDYSTIQWDKVAFKGKKKVDYNLDWSKVITNDTFSAKAAKKVDWTQISASALDSASLAKLKQDAFSGKNKKLSAWLETNTTSTTGSGSQSGISFAGIAQQKAAGALTTGQESGGSAVEVLLAAVEKQPVLI